MNSTVKRMSFSHLVLPYTDRLSYRRLALILECNKGVIGNDIIIWLDRRCDRPGSRRFRATGTAWIGTISAYETQPPYDFRVGASGRGRGDGIRMSDGGIPCYPRVFAEARC